MKVKPLPPVKVNLNFWNKLKLWFMSVTSLILWITLIIAGGSLISYYGYIIWFYGFFHEEALKYAILLVIGAYFCLVLDRKKIDEALGIKRDLPFITVEQIEKKKIK